MRRRFGRGYAIAGMAFLLTAVALSGCDLGAVGGNSSGPSAVASATRGLTSAVAKLSHQPTGTADLTWDPANKSLAVKIALTGLAPNSAHAAHIHSGTCGSNGPAVHSLNNVNADGKGVATLNQTIDNVSGGIPASGWYINVHNGTGSDQYQTMDIACANIATSTSPSQTQTVHETFSRGYGPSQDASGDAKLNIQGGKLVVTITLSGLEPTSKHAAHIHSGSCTSQGDVIHPLDDVTADGSGNATSTTTIDNVSSIPSGGWYVNVHRGLNISSPIDFDPIACGDVTAS